MNLIKKPISSDPSVWSPSATSYPACSNRLRTRSAGHSVGARTRSGMDYQLLSKRHKLLLLTSFALFHVEAVRFSRGIQYQFSVHDRNQLGNRRRDVQFHDVVRAIASMYSNLIRRQALLRSFRISGFPSSWFWMRPHAMGVFIVRTCVVRHVGHFPFLFNGPAFWSNPPRTMLL